MNNQRVKAALTANNDSRVAYAGKISQKETVTIYTDDGVAVQKEIEIFITWDTISKMLDMVRNRAGL